MATKGATGTGRDTVAGTVLVLGTRTCSGRRTAALSTSLWLLASGFWPLASDLWPLTLNRYADMYRVSYDMWDEWSFILCNFPTAATQAPLARSGDANPGFASQSQLNHNYNFAPMFQNSANNLVLKRQLQVQNTSRIQFRIL